MIMKTACIVVMTAMFLKGNAQSKTQLEEYSKLADEYLSTWSSEHAPGFALAIVKDGVMIYSKCIGMADLEHDVRINATTVFNVGSISKQFTSAAILLLEQQGKLLLDDKIKKYFPELPDYANSITIQHLMNHTSGLREMLTLQSLSGIKPWSGGDKAKTLQLIARQKSLNFQPGEEFMYSNTGYWLLAQIVEQVSGRSFALFCKEEIFIPLGMVNTHFHDDSKALIKSRAFAYEMNEVGEYINSFIVEHEDVGAGGLHTTIEDFHKWDNNFYANQLGDKSNSLIAKLEQKGRLNNGKESRYANGLFISSYKGLTNINHNGQSGNYTSSYFRFPEKRFSIFLFANNAKVQVHLYSLYELFINGIPPTSVSDRSKDFQLTEITNSSALKEFTGFYYQSPGSVIEILVQNGQLFYNSIGDEKMKLLPVGEMRFIKEDMSTELVFEVDSVSNKVKGLTRSYIQMGMKMPTAEKLVRPENLKDYQGRYCSDELTVCYNVVADGGVLSFLGDDEEILKLAMVEQDIFHGGNAVVRFIPEGSRKFVGFSISTPRVRDLRFELDNQ